jgi:hypothetical protein
MFRASQQTAQLHVKREYTHGGGGVGEVRRTGAVERRDGGLGGRPRANRIALVSRFTCPVAMEDAGATSPNKTTAEKKEARRNFCILNSKLFSLLRIEATVVSIRGRTVECFSKQETKGTTRRRALNRRGDRGWEENEARGWKRSLEQIGLFNACRCVRS